MPIVAIYYTFRIIIKRSSQLPEKSTNTEDCRLLRLNCQQKHQQKKLMNSQWSKPNVTGVTPEEKADKQAEKL